MSQENVELIARAYAALNRGEFTIADELADPNVEVASRFLFDGEVYRGVEGVQRWAADMAEAYVDVEQTIERAVQLDDERTVVAIRFRGVGRSSGVVIDQRLGVIWTIKSGRVVRIESHPSLAEALEAVGLSE